MDQASCARPLLRVLLGMGVVLCVGMLTGCQFGAKQPPPLSAPAAEVGWSHYAGSALSGAQSRPIDDAAVQRSWLVEARVLASDTPVWDKFDRLGATARLIVATRGGAPVSPSSRLTSDLLLRVVDPDFALDSLLPEPRQATLGQSVLAVAAGTTAQVQVSNITALTGGEPDAAPPLASTLIVRVSRGKEADKYELSVVVRQAVPIESSEPAAPIPDDYLVAPPLPPVKTEDREETLVVDRQFDVTDRVIVAAPMRFAGSKASQVLIDLSLTTKPADDERTSRATQALREDVLKSADAVSKRVALSSVKAEDLSVATALSALAQAGDEPRGALAYLADQCDAGLTRDVVLVADKPLLQLIAKSIGERAEGLAKRDRANIGWLLERTTVAAVSAMAGDAKHPLTPAVDGALVTYAGEVGRQLDALQSLVGRANGLADMRNRLISEHLLYLEESSPGVRVRAYDWLVSWHAAPQGYDPLDTARNRRAALERASQPATQPALLLLPTTRPTTQPATQPATTRPTTTQPTTQPDEAS